LSHDPVGQLALEIAASRGEDAKAGGPYELSCLDQHLALADPGRPFDQREHRLACTRRVRCALEGAELALALE
jgi:hypothetical protein